MMFSVVLFVEDNSVECVPTSWIEGNKCYWPSNNIKRKIQCQATPDIQVWRKFSIRVLGEEYESYDAARKHLKRAEDTSNLESEEEVRKRKRPSRFDSNESETDMSDGEADFELTTPSKKKDERIKSCLPVPPDSDFKPRRRSPRKSPLKKSNNTDLSQSTPQRTFQKTSFLGSNMCSPSPINSTPETSVLEPRACSSRLSSTNISLIEESVADRPDDKTMLGLILSKITAIEEDVKLIRGVVCEVEDEPLTSYLRKPLANDEEVQEFGDSLDETKKKKMITALASLQGGDNGPKICRKIMRAVMTNGCMSLYSGTGQKGKLSFMETKLFAVVMSAARKASKKQLSIEALKFDVFDVLRVAPNKPGGINFEKKKEKALRKRMPDIPEDSD